MSPIETIAAQPPLGSHHTSTFVELLQQFGASVLVTTYQAGKLMVLRADGDVLNTHFCGFARPMGLAAQSDRLVIGTNLEIWEYRNTPAAVPDASPAGGCDACYLPRRSHVTGDIQVHEMAWAGDELVFVNTRFSCLAVRDHDYSFRPIWKPPFISELAPDDRCHLNGLGVCDGEVRLVTALGECDAPALWREHKRAGGVLIDVPSGEVIARGLSMPHSPRLHNGKIWLLESGAGTLGTVDPASGKYEPLVELPGFTRGLDFLGRYALVGLSQVRESAQFSGIPLVERLAERSSGVWVIDLDSAQVVAWVKFDDAVQEIFAVQVLPGSRFPEVTNTSWDLAANAFVLPNVFEKS